MCGIAGFNWNDKGVITGMAEALGDDDSDVRWVVGEALIALGHCAVKTAAEDFDEVAGFGSVLPGQSSRYTRHLEEHRPGPVTGDGPCSARS